MLEEKKVIKVNQLLRRSRLTIKEDCWSLKTINFACLCSAILFELSKVISKDFLFSRPDVS